MGWLLPVPPFGVDFITHALQVQLLSTGFLQCVEAKVTDAVQRMVPCSSGISVIEIGNMCAPWQQCIQQSGFCTVRMLPARHANRINMQLAHVYCETPGAGYAAMHAGLAPCKV